MSITEYIDQIFNRTLFNIRIEDEDHIFIEDKNDELCLEILISEDNIYINNLVKCNAGRGSELLNKIIQLSQLIKKPIHLTDASVIIKCDDIYINLQCLHILSYGISWYNMFGFNSENQEEINEFNNQIINQLLRDFLDYIIQKSQEIYEHNIENIPSKENLIERLKKGSSNKRIQDYIKEQIDNYENYKSEKEENLLKELNKNISIIEGYKIKYNNYLNWKTKDFFLYCTDHIFKNEIEDCEQIKYLGWLLEYIYNIKAIKMGELLVRPYDYISDTTHMDQVIRGGGNINYEYLNYSKKNKRRYKKNIKKIFTKRKIYKKKKRSYKRNFNTLKKKKL